MENASTNTSPTTPNSAHTPNTPTNEPNKKTRIILIVVLAVIALLVVGVFIRAARNRQGIRGIFRRNTTVSSTNNTTATNTINSTNSTNNSTSNSTNNTSNSSGNSTNSNGGNGGTGGTVLDKYPAGKSTISLSFGGVSRSAIIYVPKSYSPTNPFPLVVNLHGSESSAEGQENNSHMDRTAEANNFIVVYPEGINKEWNDGRAYTKSRTGNADDVGFIKQLVKTISEGMNINKGKVYAVGMSNGGMMAQRLACDATSTFAAIGDVAGAMPTDLKNACSPSGRMPVIIIHGTSDPIVPFSGGNLNSGRGSVLSTMDAVHYWAGVNGASATNTGTVEINTVSDDTTITHQYFGPNVELFQVNNGGHTWPGGLQYLRPIIIGLVSKDIDASQQVWNFFRNFSR